AFSLLLFAIVLIFGSGFACVCCYPVGGKYYFYYWKIGRQYQWLFSAEASWVFLSVLAVLLILPAAWVASGMVSRAITKYQRLCWDRADRLGRCRGCGYDLRATPERCPECGTIPTKVKA